MSTALKKMEGTKAMTGGWKDYVIAWPENDDDRNLCDQLYNEAKARFEAGTLYQSTIPKENKQSKKTTDVELDSDPSEDASKIRCACGKHMKRDGAQVNTVAHADFLNKQPCRDCKDLWPEGFDLYLR